MVCRQTGRDPLPPMTLLRCGPFVLSVALMAVCAAVLFYAGLRGRDRLRRVTAFAGGLASLGLLTATIIGFNNN